MLNFKNSKNPPFIGTSVFILLMLIGIVSFYVINPFFAKKPNVLEIDTYSKDVANLSDSITDTPFEIMAWMYPGEPSCGAMEELMDGRKIDVIKPEYYTVNDKGMLTFLTEEEYGCNGFSIENISLIREHSKEQFVTISSSDPESMRLYLERAIVDQQILKEPVDFVVKYDLSGIEIDFESFSAWDEKLYRDYKEYITQLGLLLESKGKQLMIAGPPIANDEEQAWYMWRYKDFVTLPVAYIVVMAYDYQFDHGAGVGVSPIPWLRDIIQRMKKEVPDQNRLVIGLPLYGYCGVDGTQELTLLTDNQLREREGYLLAEREVSSHEMTWKRAGEVCFFQDLESIQKKLEIVKLEGLNSVSFWHIGGNKWPE